MVIQYALHEFWANREATARSQGITTDELLEREEDNNSSTSTEEDTSTDHVTLYTSEQSTTVGTVGNTTVHEDFFDTDPEMPGLLDMPPPIRVFTYSGSQTMLRLKGAIRALTFMIRIMNMTSKSKRAVRPRFSIFPRFPLPCSPECGRKMESDAYLLEENTTRRYLGP